MIWSIIRMRAAKRMFDISRWLLRVGEAILDEEMARAAVHRGADPLRRSNDALNVSSAE